MIVDDSRVVHMEMSKLLADSDLEIVKCCRSGEEAIASYESVQPDVVTMDIVMPGMDGLETCGEIVSRWPDARVIMVSSLAYDDTVNSAAAVGAKGLVFKPFDREMLLEALHKALADG